MLFLSHDPYDFAMNISGAAIGHLVLVGIVILIYFHCDRLMYYVSVYNIYGFPCHILTTPYHALYTP